MFETQLLFISTLGLLFRLVSRCLPLSASNQSYKTSGPSAGHSHYLKDATAFSTNTEGSLSFSKQNVGGKLGSLPDCIELYSLPFNGSQVRYQGEMRHLSGRPSKLENDYKWDIVHKLCPGRCLTTGDALLKEEWEGRRHTKST